MVVSFAARLARRPARATVLHMTIEGEIPEQSAHDVLSRFFGGDQLTLADHLEAIAKAKQDDRISGLFLSVDRNDLGWARTQELRDAIAEFRAAGKWAVAWLETAGEFSPGNKEYYLATACESIWLAPPGDINLVGLRAEAPFLRGALDKLDIYPDYASIGKYKSAKDLFTDRTMTEAHRESMDRLVASLYGQLTAGIAAGRNKSEDEVRAIIDGGPYIGPKALQAGLVDGLGYYDEVEETLRGKNGGTLPKIRTGRYLRNGRWFDRGTKIAVIYGTGAVVRGEGGHDALTGAGAFGSETVAATIREAREDGSIAAIVLRVQSPGGSYVASDLVWREVKRTRGVKPIVVSMGDVAASGGYFVSMAADRIVAEPATLTASIGVVAGKFVTTGFWNKIGVTSDAVQRGRHATYFSADQPYTPEERVLFQEWLERIYTDFVTKAAAGRGKSFEAIHRIAQGRVWSGQDAMEHGLVDEAGGLMAAIRAALRLANRDPEGRVQIVEYPEPEGLFDRFLGGDDDNGARGALARVRSRIRGVIEDGPAPSPGETVLRMPYEPLIR
jgi:protease-4